jgi:hypothetical protein
MTAAYGRTVWASRAWLDEALAWLDGVLARRGTRRTGPGDQPHLRPWATVLRVPTTEGTVWLKAAGPQTAFEVRLYEVLARTAPDAVLHPIAVDVERAWIVLPDGGPPIGERLHGTAQLDALADALVHYGRVQRDLAPHVDELLAAGVADMRPSVLPERFDEAIATTAVAIERAPRPGDTEMHARVAAMRPEVEAWSGQLAASRIPATIDHNDLHPWNVLGGDGTPWRFYDWGDGVVAHAFAALLVPLTILRRELGITDDHDPRLVRARDRYLEGFADLAPGEDLATTLTIACRLAAIARTLVWERALRAAYELGDEVPDEWAHGHVETIAQLLDPSPFGAA